MENAQHSSASSKQLLVAVIEAHGGIDRWRRVGKIQAKWLFHGVVLEVKGYPGMWQPTITIATQGEPSSVMTGLGFGKADDQWHFSPQHVSVESSDGTIVKERSDPRSAYTGQHLTTPWDDLHLNYFVSYAFYNYLTAPWIFLSPDFSFAELDSHSEPGSTETWRVLEVTFPDTFPTHTKVQRFYFGAHEFPAETRRLRD